MNGPSPRMVELAELLVDTVAHADWAMFAKNGNDVTSMACVLARAATGRRKVLKAHAAYHGASPWFTPAVPGWRQLQSRWYWVLAERPWSGARPALVPLSRQAALLALERRCV